MSDYLQAAFEACIPDATQSSSWYVVLMERTRFYGGPQEGGWYGSDHIVQAYREYPSEELARKAAKQVETLANELKCEAQARYGEHCLFTMEWLEERGLDADFLPEPDGPSEFYVCVQDEIPQNRYGNRHWE